MRTPAFVAPATTIRLAAQRIRSIATAVMDDAPHATRISDLRFVNSLPSRLRADRLTPGEPTVTPTADNPSSHLPRPVPGAHFSYVLPQPPPNHDASASSSQETRTTAGTNAILISVSDDAARSVVGLKPLSFHHLRKSLTQQDQDLESVKDDGRLREFVDVMSGAKVPAGTNPWSLNYGGHQFGSWAGQLGDGRAVTLGEVVHSRTGARCEMQLKGSGMTPYSRFADGLAVLRSSIREYLCSEAMHAFGIPTSRALAIVATPTRRPLREEGPELGAIVCRLAPTWIRFGSFEIHYSRGEYDLLRELADYTIETHFPDVLAKVLSASPSNETNADDETQAIQNHLANNKYLAWFKSVVEKTADMIAHWQAVGFCHGVMNTDNFSILGLTIDYGPFQFMDVYDPAYICNHSDEMGRYAFYEQPRMALWNLTRLASVIDPLLMRKLPLSPSDLSDVSKTEAKACNDALVDAIRGFVGRWDTTFCEIMSRKLGFTVQRKDDLMQVYQPLLRIMHDAELDYTLFFRALSKLSIVPERIDESTFDAWQKLSAKPRSAWTDPHVSGLSDADGDASSDNAPPGAPQAGHSIVDRFQEWYKAYRLRVLEDAGINAGSTDRLTDIDAARHRNMLAINPKYVLRNHLAQKVIDETTADPVRSDAVDRYLAVLQRPFDEGTDEEDREFGGVVPNSVRGIKCSCSS